MEKRRPKITDDRGAYNFVILNLSISANNPSLRILAGHMNSIT